MAGDNLLNKRVPELPELLRRLRNDDLVVVYDFVSDTTYRMRGENIVPGGLARPDEYIIYEYPADVSEGNPFMLAEDRVMVVRGNSIYKLVYPSRPYGSTNLDEEIDLGHWVKVSGEDVTEWVLAPDATSIGLDYKVSSHRYIVANSASTFGEIAITSIPNGREIAVNILSCDGQIIALGGAYPHKNSSGSAITRKILPTSGNFLTYAKHAVDEAGAEYILWQDAVEAEAKELSPYDFLRQYEVGDTILDGDILYIVDEAWPSFDGTAEYPYFNLGDVPAANLRLIGNLDGHPSVLTSNLTGAQGGQGVSVNVQHQRITANPAAPDAQQIDFLVSGRIPLGRRKILEYVWNGKSVIRSFNRASGDPSIPVEAVSGDVIVYDLYAYVEDTFTIRRKYIQGKEGTGTGGTGTPAVDIIEEGNMNASTSNAVFKRTNFSSYTPYATKEEINDTDVIASQSTLGVKLKLTLSLLRDWLTSSMVGKYKLTQPNGISLYGNNLQAFVTAAEPFAVITLYSDGPNEITYITKSLTIDTNGKLLRTISDTLDFTYNATGTAQSIRIVGGGVLGSYSIMNRNSDVYIDVEIDQRKKTTVPYTEDFRQYFRGNLLVVTKRMIMRNGGEIRFVNPAGTNAYLLGGAIAENTASAVKFFNSTASYAGTVYFEGNFIGANASTLIDMAGPAGKVILSGNTTVENTYSGTVPTGAGNARASAMGWSFSGSNTLVEVRGSAALRATAGNPPIYVDGGGARVINIYGEMYWGGAIASNITFNKLTPYSTYQQQSVNYTQVIGLETQLALKVDKSQPWIEIPDAAAVVADFNGGANRWHTLAAITSLEAINIPNGADYRINLLGCDGRSITLIGTGHRDHRGLPITTIQTPSDGYCYLLINNSVDATGGYLSWTLLDDGVISLGNEFLRTDQQETQVVTYQPGASLEFLPDPGNEWSRFGSAGQGDYLYKSDVKITPYGVDAQGETNSRDSEGVTTDYYQWYNQPLHWTGVNGGMDGFGHSIKYDNTWSGQFAGVDLYAGSTAGRASKIELLVDYSSRMVINATSISLGVYATQWNELVITADDIKFKGKSLGFKDETVEVITLAGSVANVTMDSNRDAYISGGTTPGTIAIGGTALPNKFRVIPITGNGASAPEVTGALPEPNIAIGWVAANAVNTLYLRTGYSPAGVLSTYYMWV